MENYINFKKQTKFLLLTILAIILLFLPIGNCLNAKADILIEPKVGTQGLGLDISNKFTPFTGIRLSGNYLDGKTDGKIEDISYDIDAKLLNAGALIDIYPLGGSFRISAGGFYSDNELDINARLNNDIKIGDITFSKNDVGTFSGNIKQKSKFSPYIGIGRSKSYAILGGLGFNFDIGVKFTGKYDVDAKSIGGALTGNSSLENEIAKEEQKIKDDLDDYKFYPVVSVGITLEF